ncbi:hypothetical protein SERN_0710 [Serinibacter arcticus]|uniref:Uncharacterized protein n=1 Tax=Serinibacter arcticus TaxID=1655435 RepID=A0A4Z1E6N0_9MICO|nr:hypothetical protein SERN_0710 [Serinibacter arcticus]
MLALAACTPPQGSSSEESGSVEPGPTESSETSGTASPSPSQSESTDHGGTTRPTDEPQTDGEQSGDADTGSPFEFVRGLPSGVEEAPADSAAGVGWNEAGDALYVVTFGSSSCPLVPQTVEQAGGGLEITLAAAGGAVCTMDIVPTYATVAPPSGVASDAPVTAVLGDLGQVTVPPAATPTQIGWLAAEAG